MPIKLNLLPPEYSVSGGTARILKTIRMLGVISLAGFLVFALGLLAFFIVSSVQLRNINESTDQLKSEIAAQETSEQQIVLLKDRLQKIKSLQNQISNKNLNNASSLVTSLPPGATLSELSLDSQKIDISILFRSAAELSSFITTIESSEIFKSALLTSFGFNPITGYLLTVRLI